jgi:hypothetical protein
MTTGVCSYCAWLKRLRDDGTVPTHFIAIRVSRTAVRTVGRGQVKRCCSGSGRPPREDR